MTFDSLTVDQKYIEKIIRDDDSVFSVEIGVEFHVIKDPKNDVKSYILTQQDKLPPYTTQKIKVMKSKGQSIIRKSSSSGKYTDRDVYLSKHKIQIFHNETHIQKIIAFEQSKEKTLHQLRVSSQSDYPWTPEKIHETELKNILQFIQHPLDTISTELSMETTEDIQDFKLGSYVAQLILSGNFPETRFTIIPHTCFSHFRPEKPELYFECILVENETEDDAPMCLPACVLLRKYGEKYVQLCNEALEYFDQSVAENFYENELQY